MPALSSIGLAFYAATLVSAFAVRSAAGFGAGLVAVPMLALILPISTAVSITAVLTTLTSAHQISREWHQIAWRHFLFVFLYSVLGIGLGLYFLTRLDEHLLRRCLGAFLILYSAHALRSTYTTRSLPTRWHGALAACTGIVGGLFSALFGAGAGPIYVIYFNVLRLEKTVFRATMSAVVLLGGAARIVGYGSNGFYGTSTITLLAMGLPLVIAGSWLGDRVVYRLSAPSFSRLVAAIILLSGIALLVR